MCTQEKCVYVCARKKNISGRIGNAINSPVKLNQSWKTTLIGTASKIIRDNYSYFNLESLSHPATVVPPIMDFSIREHWTNISIQNRTKYYNSIQWDFGDGNRSKDKDPKHLFASPGEYKIRQELSSYCKNEVLERTITVD
jgi:PKD repeat protein